MKKLMFAVAALAAGVACADAIVSNNTVGYQNINLPAGYAMITPTFKTIDAAPVPLQSITVAGANVTGDGDVSVSFMTADGQWAGQYWWLTQDGWGAEKDGWYTMSDVPATETLADGVAIMVSADNEGTSLVVSGAVAMDVVEVSIPKGYVMVGNATPVSISINDIVPEGAAITGDGDVSVSFMTADGQWAGQYWWLTQDGWGAEKDGWYTMSDEPATEMLPPGASVMLSCDNEGVKLTMPAAITTVK